MCGTRVWVQHELSIEGDLIFKGERLLIPYSAREYIMERAHAAHMGINACVNRAKDICFWIGMTSDIEKFVSRCSICAKYHNDQCKETLINHETPSYLWEFVACDLFVHNGHDYLITVDRYSNFWEVDRLYSTRSRWCYPKVENAFQSMEYRWYFTVTMVLSFLHRNSRILQKNTVSNTRRPVRTTVNLTD